MVWLIQNDCDFQTAQSDLLSRSPFLESVISLSLSLSSASSDWFVVTQTTFHDVGGQDGRRRRPPHRDQSGETGQDGPQAGHHVPLAVGADESAAARHVQSDRRFHWSIGRQSFLIRLLIGRSSKVVYVARNPKDVIVSYYHHHKLFKMYGFNGDVDVFADYFLTDQSKKRKALGPHRRSRVHALPFFLCLKKVMFGPYFPHLMAAWKQRHHPNMHFLFYEDLKQVCARKKKNTVRFLIFGRRAGPQGRNPKSGRFPGKTADR